MNQPQNDSDPPIGPHPTLQEKPALPTQLWGAGEQPRSDVITRLTWRPSWAIRSRRGGWSAMKKLFRQ